MKGFSGVGIVNLPPETVFTALDKNVSSVFPFGKMVNSTTDATITAGIEIR
jgi:hypothetical protein